MGTTLKFSSSFHPQTDGQSEEANSTVLDLLKCYVSEHKATWKHYLPLVEYAYNNTVHTSTGKVPFEIVEGGKKVPPILQTKDKIFEADKYVQNTDEAYRKIKLALEKTQSKQKKAADRHRRELVFSLGDWVLLRFEKARLRKMKGKERLFPKLGMRYYGPFQVCDKISDVAYRLKLPEDWKIHNAFHVSLLRPFVGDMPEDMVPEEQSEVEELDEILVPEQILAHKDRRVRGKVARRYLVKFKNYSPMDAKWMEEAELEAQRRRSDVRIQYAKFLQDIVKEMAKEIKATRTGDAKRTAEDLDEFMNRVRTGENVSNNDILGFAKLFNDEMTLDNLSRPRLISMCKYMGIKPYGTDAYLCYMLRSKLAGIKNDDRLIQTEGIELLSEAELQAACRARGILNVYTVEEMRQQLKNWLDLSLNHSVPSSLLLLSRSFNVSGKMKPEEAVQATLSSLPDEVVDSVGTSELPSEEGVLGERLRKLEFIKMQEEMIKVDHL
ncbi:hypothetical protein L7F22_065528 [Adiantum nelumboides]|nr:hypothetical protein [Adiantum nelumboides]